MLSPGFDRSSSSLLLYYNMYYIYTTLQHSTLYTLHAYTLYTLHSALCSLLSTLYSLLSTLYTPTLYTLHAYTHYTLHSTCLHTLHAYTCYTLHTTLHYILQQSTRLHTPTHTTRSKTLILLRTGSNVFYIFVCLCVYYVWIETGVGGKH